MKTLGAILLVVVLAVVIFFLVRKKKQDACGKLAQQYGLPGNLSCGDVQKAIESIGTGVAHAAESIVEYGSGVGEVKAAYNALNQTSCGECPTTLGDAQKFVAAARALPNVYPVTKIRDCMVDKCKAKFPGKF